MKHSSMMGPAVLGLAAVATVGAVGAYAAHNKKGHSKMKKVAKKVARGAEKAVLDLDKMVSKYT